MPDVDVIAIDFETATAQRWSVCEVGICVVRGGEVAETLNWLVRPPENRYSYWNMRVHGIRPIDTATAPAFPEVWEAIAPLVERCPVLVAHNAAFDIGCLRHTLQHYDLAVPRHVDCYCTLRVARRLYGTKQHNTLDELCARLGIPHAHHHRAGADAEMCARLLLHELSDAGVTTLDALQWCRRQL